MVKSLLVRDYTQLISNLFTPDALKFLIHEKIDDNQKSYTLETFISELYITLTSYDIDLNQFRNFFQNLTDCLKYIERNIRLDINSEELKNRISNSNGNVGTNSSLGEEDLESTAPGM